MDNSNPTIKTNETNNEADNENSNKNKWRSPLQKYKEYRARKRIERERALLLREERMNEDLERYLMEMEDQRCWLAFQLNHINFQRIKKKEAIQRIQRKELEKIKIEEDEHMKENGLTFFQGNIKNYKRWQQSPAKHLDFNGHSGPVLACKLSPCLEYLLSASDDKTLRIWSMFNGECLKVLKGHMKVVNDCDFHPAFKMFRKEICIVSGSGDGTLKLWNSADQVPVSTIYAHDQSVYRCAFSPCGNTILSCSEDMTIRTWNFPEGYNLFIYQAHSSPVTSIRFSLSGRYFASGSNYGERKILLWDSKYPKFQDPAQFPHIIMWSPEGIITKILIRKGAPKTGFWLAQNQLGYVEDDDALEVWDGELSDPELSSNSDGEDNEDGDDDMYFSGTNNLSDESRADNLLEKEGVQLKLSVITNSAEKVDASEYNPGGFVIVKIQSIFHPIESAFISAYKKDTRFDIFSSRSSQKVGAFQLESPIPGGLVKVKVDTKGRTVTYRDVPEGLRYSKDGKSIIYNNLSNEYIIPQIIDDNQDLQSDQVNNTKTITEFELIWNCPEPDLGNVIFVVNFKLNDVEGWNQVRSTLKESPIRVNLFNNLDAEDPNSKKFMFDQVERHRQFWNFIREKDYNSLATFIHKKAVAYLSQVIINKRFRIVNLLVDIFDEASWLVLHTPFIFKPGVTKSSILCDTTFDNGEGEENSQEELKSLEDFTTLEESIQIEEKTEEKVNESIEPLEEGQLENLQKEEIDVPNDVFPDDLSQLSLEKINQASKNEEVENDNTIDNSSYVSKGSIIKKVRPRTKDQNLHTLSFIREIDNKTFQNSVDNSFNKEYNRFLFAEDNNYEVALEIGLHGFHPYLLNKIKALLPESHWLSHFDYIDFINEFRQFQYSKASREGTQLLGITDDIPHDPRALPDLLKSGKFGPDIEDFSMELPQMFPKSAGGAKYALQPNIERYQKVLDKMKVESLPTTLEEVHEPTIPEITSKIYHNWNETEKKLYNKRIGEFLRKEIECREIRKNYHLSSRRSTYFSLPGLSPHYPNPNYHSPAYLPQSLDFLRPPKVTLSFFDRLLGKNIPRIHQVLPVGRKPSIQERIRIQNLAYSGKLNISQYSEEKKDFQINIMGNISFGEDSINEQNTGSSHSKNANKSKKKNKTLELNEDGLPKEFYSGRRSYYPYLPGLEEFISDLEKQNSNKNNSLAETTSQDSELVPGLLRRFKINGFELAHHGAVNDLIFSPSETRLVSAGGDGLIKIWDPRDGSFVKSLQGHIGSVQSVQYTSNEQFLVSAGADSLIIIWSLLTQNIQRILRGHVDLIYSLSISPDCSFIISSSHDQVLKSWCTTPRNPDIPEPPRVLNVTDTTALISWTAPPSFNCDITAFHYQYRIGKTGEWIPADGKSVAPHLRSKTVPNLMPAALYQFRIQAENRMGLSRWSFPSKPIKTEVGLPVKFDQPLIARMTSHSLFAMWFSHNPQTFGAASEAFHIECSGAGKGFEDFPQISINFEDAFSLGQIILKQITSMVDRYYKTKDALIKSKGFNLHTRQSEMDKNIFEISNELSIESILNVFKRSKHPDYLLFGAEYSGLEPGFLYSLRLRGQNSAGVGEWTDPTLSVSSLPTPPSAPSPPFIAQATLRSLTFQWNPPKMDGGSAITGYQIYLQNVNKYIDLPRSSITYKWEGLFPGKSYFMKVLAKNIVGNSEFSEFNSLDQSYTTVAPPETSQNPIAVQGTWNSITFEVNIPFHNGSRVKKMEVSYRTIEPFVIGDWTFYKEFNVMDNSKDVEFVSFVDLDKQQEEMELLVRAFELEKSKDGFSPYKKVSSPENDNEIENKINSIKPEGSRIRFEVSNLSPSTMYETRVRFSNPSGFSSYSHPSHRAKTNKASLPDCCEIPGILLIGSDFVVIEIQVPKEGGSPIKFFTIEAMDMDMNSTISLKNTYSSLDGTTRIQVRIPNLRKKGNFVFRCRAETSVGLGEFSSWSDEISLIEDKK